MCGLSCIISNHKEDLELLQVMNDSIVHRGPDGEGKTYNEVSSFYVGMGHRRLAILDLNEHGLQPFIYKDLELIFNGEIYNYIEIRKELNQVGYEFQTNTDTEVLLKSFAHWGEDCLSRFNGMFSFVILDKEKGEMFGARDRFGIKPLYYFKSGERLVFFSEIKQIISLSFFKPILNYQTAYDFLMFGLTDHSTETFFKNVYQVLPGNSFKIDLNNGLDLNFDLFYTRLYQDTKSVSQANEDEFKSIFNSSIDLRLRADVLVGSCLSGGLDSSSIVSLVNHKLKAQGKSSLQKTFSSCSLDERFDERKFIKIMEDGFAINNIKTFPSGKEFFDDFSELVRSQDEPFISTSIYAQNRVFKLAKDSNVTVILDGQGADEILAGYQTFFKPLLYSYFLKFRIVSFLRECWHLKVMHSIGAMEVLKSLIVRIFPEYFINILRRKFNSEALTHRYFNFNDGHVHFKSPKSYKENKIGDMNDFSRFLLRAGNLPMLLRFEDRNSMANSVEARVPFLDHNLVEFCLNLSPEWKIYKGVTKTILREAMRRVLPEEIRNRQDKMGFVTPEEVWFKEEEPGLFLKSLEESVELSNGIINPEIMDDAKAFVSGQMGYDNRFFRAICFGKWIKVFGVQLERHT